MFKKFVIPFLAALLVVAFAVPVAAAVPGAPTGLTLTVDAATRTINASWTAPADDGGFAIDNYVVNLSGDASDQQTPTGTSASFGPLAPGNYTISVAAENIDGAGPLVSDSATVLVADPGPATGVSATVVGQTVTISWSAPADDGGDPALFYTAIFGAESAGTDAALSLEFPNVAPGTYTAVVETSNAAGTSTSAASGEFTVAAPASPPGAPGSASASVDGQTVNVSWTAPADDGGDPNVVYSVALPGATTQTGIAGLSASFPGLAAGDYTATVTASNGAGDGGSVDSNTVTVAAPATVPGVPQNVEATPAGTSVTVSWTAPASNGGSVISGYSVTLDGGTPVPVSGLSTTFDSLSVGPHSVTVAAVNAVGTGGSDSASFTIAAPITAPSVPQNVSASVDNQSITVTWDASADDGGDSPVTYEVSIPGLTPQSGEETSQTFTNVPAGDHVATVVASTPTGGESGSVAANSVTVAAPASAPGQPTELTATVSGLSVLISWVAPAANGAPIQDYLVSLNGSDSTAADTPISFENLSPGDYTVTVAARNSEGTGPTATETFTIEVPIIRPSTPTNVNATVNNQQVTVTWTASDDGGADSVEYNVSLNGGTPRVVSGTSTQFEGVGAGNYTVTVTASNSAGTSGAGSDTFSVVTAPSAPRSLAAAAQGSSIIATWAAPANTGNQSLGDYEVGLEQNGNRLETKTASAGTTSISFDGRSPGTYTVTIRATNGSGSGPFASIEVEVGTTAPSAPTNVSGSARFQTVTVTWDPPLSAGNSPLTGYEVTVGGVTQSVDAGTRSVVLVDIEPGEQIAEVTALNAGGAGLAGESAPFITETVFAPFETSSDLISRQYLDFLGRPADQAGLDYWTGVLGADRNQGPIVIENFMRSAEFAPRRSIARLYLAFFDRAPDRGGFDFWAQTLRDGARLNDIAAAFADSEEFRTTYGELNDAEFIALVYNNVLLRQPDLDGFRFWLERMQDPNVSRGDLMVAFSESAEFKRNSSPAVDVIMTYRGMLDRAPDPGGFAFWVSAVAGQDNALRTLIFNFLVSEEYSNRVG